MRSPAFPPRRPSQLVRYIVPAVFLLCVFYYLSNPRQAPIPETSIIGSGSTIVDGSHSGSSQGSNGVGSSGSSSGSSSNSNDNTNANGNVNPVNPGYSNSHQQPMTDNSASGKHSHPIDALIANAEMEYHDLLEKETKSLEDAAAAYRERRGRHPPPGFHAWYEFAKSKKALIIEDFWDQIYHDLRPFWAVDPKLMRREAVEYEMNINVRNGNASAKSDWFWTQIWLNMTKTIEHLLPDMDIALNPMDEPRLVVPFEDIAPLVEKEQKSRSLPSADKVVSSFERLPHPKKMPKTPAIQKKRWESGHPYWPIARRGCPPDSPARQYPVMTSFDKVPEFAPEFAGSHQFYGFVSNWTRATEFCHQPDLQGLEGIFIYPQSTSATKTLFPMFGGSKLATNNEILLPAPMYWNEEVRFTGGDDHGIPWSRKMDAAIWRGVSTGGHNKRSNWRGFQRHRFVSMNNGTMLTRAEQHIEEPLNFMLPDTSYKLGAQQDGRLGKWVSRWADVGFTHLTCDDDLEVEQDWGHCFYTDDYYDILASQDMAEQFDYKYLPDIDGNSFSGRYLGFLRSTSLPIKSTLWKEWHDSRLVAWKHFVPMDNRFGDYYSIMEYFLGYDDVVEPHDVAARKIAMNGKMWAEKVLRKEDMQVYTLRLLLEYARISHEDRDSMGWVGDLLDKGA